MAKRLINRKHALVKIILALFVLSVLALTVRMPMVKAQYVTLSPSSGPVGTTVSVGGAGFVAGPVSITFNGTQVAMPNANANGGLTPVTFIVPSTIAGPNPTQAPIINTPPGAYVVTATDSSGDTVSNTFTVTAIATPSPAPSSTPTVTSSSITTATPYSPTVTPTTQSVGFWSPLAIALTAVVIAFAIFMTAVYLRRGNRKTPQIQEASPYEPRPSTPSNPNAPSNINQPYQPYQSSRVNQPYQSSRVNQPYQSSRVNQPYQSSRVNQPYQSSRVNQPYQSSRVNQPYQSSRVNQPVT